MNKLVKGSIAGAAGIALLLGGAGTLATWNDSATVFTAGSNITAGTLDIEATTGANDGWSDDNGPIDIADFLVVPGDTLTYTKTFDVTASGDNLSAEAALGTGAIKPKSNSNINDVALAAALTGAVDIGFTVDTVDTVDTDVIDTDSQEIVVTVVIEFPKAGAGAENDWKLGAVNLDDFTVTLSQI